jgi:hypothetical protein
MVPLSEFEANCMVTKLVSVDQVDGISPVRRLLDPTSDTSEVTELKVEGRVPDNLLKEKSKFLRDLHLPKSEGSDPEIEFASINKVASLVREPNDTGMVPTSLVEDMKTLIKFVSIPKLSVIVEKELNLRYKVAKERRDANESGIGPEREL